MRKKKGLKLSNKILKNPTKSIHHSWNNQYLQKESHSIIRMPIVNQNLQKKKKKKSEAYQIRVSNPPFFLGRETNFIDE